MIRRILCTNPDFKTGFETGLPGTMQLMQKGLYSSYQNEEKPVSMTRYIAFAALIFLVILVVFRTVQLKRLGIKAFQFGEMDKKDFFIPPFALLLFYIVFAGAFGLPNIGIELFSDEFVGWLGAAICILGILLFIRPPAGSSSASRTRANFWRCQARWIAGPSRMTWS
jgi:hypothetical protein